MREKVLKVFLLQLPILDASKSISRLNLQGSGGKTVNTPVSPLSEAPAFPSINNNMRTTNNHNNNQIDQIIIENNENRTLPFTPHGKQPQKLYYYIISLIKFSTGTPQK